MTAKNCGAPLPRTSTSQGKSAKITYPSANISVSIRARPRPEVFMREAVEVLIQQTPFVPNMREALQRLEDEGYIVVVDELPVAPAPGLRQRGVA